MQGLAGLLFPVLLMILALGMEKFERLMGPTHGESAPAADAAAAAVGEPGPTVETLAKIGLPSAVERLDLDRDEDPDEFARDEREADRRTHRRAS